MADTQTIKERIDIVQLIGEYVQLKKAGVNWRATCPFHHEKTPSFMVHPEKQIWHCFGCNKGGDIFSFIQEIEGLDFIEALKILAQRAGVAVDIYKNETNFSQRNRLAEITAKAAAFYHHILTAVPGAQIARDYLAKRKLSDQIIKIWQIGFAPEQWDLLTKYLIHKGYAIDDLVAAGLTIRREGADIKSGRGFYDRFRGRIMFPITDVHGTIAGFTGRVLVETQNSGGKYVNTPQTLLYDKSRVLYGLYQAKTEIKAKDLAVLVEGQMDVIACHQVGMKNVVAVSGTALTPEQIKLLKRYTNNLAVAFDADAAGQSAGKRGSAAALEAGMQVRVIQIPKEIAKDADECLKKNPSIWFDAVEKASGLLEWYFRTILSSVKKDHPVAKQQATDELLSHIARIPFAVERDEWLKRLGSELAVDVGVLREELQRIKRQKLPHRVVNAAKNVPAFSVLGYYETLLQEFWSLIIKFPEAYGSVENLLREEYFLNTAFQLLYGLAKEMYTIQKKLDINSLRQKCNIVGVENFLDVLLLQPFKNGINLSPESATLELCQLADRIKHEWRKKRGKEIQREMARAEEKGAMSTVEDLMRELQILTL